MSSPDRTAYVRSPAACSTLTTSRSPACSPPRSCAVRTPTPGSSRSIPPRPRRYPASRQSSTPGTSGTEPSATTGTTSRSRGRRSGAWATRWRRLRPSTSATARRAAELIEIDYEPLPAVVDVHEALMPGASVIHDERSDRQLTRLGRLPGRSDPVGMCRRRLPPGLVRTEPRNRATQGQHPSSGGAVGDSGPHREGREALPPGSQALRAGQPGSGPRGPQRDPSLPGGTANDDGRNRPLRRTGRELRPVRGEVARPQRGREGSRLAGRLPLHATATGKVLAAFSPPDVARALVGSDLGRMTSYTIVVPSVLLEQFDQTRRRGWGAEREECVLGWASVAAPVFGLGGTLMGAISATLPSAGLIEESVATRVVFTARAASRTMGRGLGPSRPEVGR